MQVEMIEDESNWQIHHAPYTKIGPFLRRTCSVDCVSAFCVALQKSLYGTLRPDQ